MPVVVDDTRWRLEAHAIVSAEGRIADASGAFPEGLRHPVDQARFQGMLERAALAVLGTEGHARHPRRPGRRRLVVTSRVEGVAEAEPEVWRWNPAGASVADALIRAAPGGGLVVVTGGARVFDLCLQTGLDRFDLAIAHDCALPEGRPCLPGIDDLDGIGSAFRAAGLSLASAEWLDPVGRVELRRYAG